MTYVLHVKVIEATDIAKMDGLFGKSDPYVVLNLDGQVHKTAVIKNTQHPRWNVAFQFPVTNMNGMLRLLMRDEDVVKDDDMARLDLSLNAIKFGQVIDQWYPMTPVKHVKKGGQIHLMLHLCDARDPPFVQRAYAPPQGAPGYYPPQGAPGFYPPQPQMYAPNQPMYPPQAPGMAPMYPPQAPGMYPPPGQPQMYPPQAPGMYPPPGQPQMYPQQMYPPQHRPPY